ncbi:unnamed protein product [Paramecium sonneborni]|uniref:Uncharacterized protein n=1 Tax=Paramecium sonneborni TaxID=65129 RepID=A0A8S1RUQ4_9CILI|nr:unnamed protein product [Paramecium sonneborni]
MQHLIIIEQLKFEYGLNYILVRQLNIINCWFRSTNQFDRVWVNKLNENQMQNTIQVWEFCEVKSKGANLYIVTQELQMKDCQLDGVGMFIVTQGKGNLFINNTIFRNMITNLDSKYLTQGGGLAIDAKASTLQLTLSFINMNNCQRSSKNQQLISINDSKFTKCQSLTSQFMEDQFFDFINQIVQMNNLRIENNNLEEFLPKVPALTDSEIDQFKVTASPYTQSNGQLKTNKIYIFNIANQNIIYATNLYFNQIQFVNNTIFSAPLFRLTLKDELGTAYLGSITFSGNTQFIPQKGFQVQIVLGYDEQTCDIWQENIALVDQIFSDAHYYIQDLELEQEYLKMSNKDKYEWDEIFNQLQPTFDDIPLNFQYNQNFKDCIFSILLDEISNKTAAYIQIQNVREGNQINERRNRIQQQQLPNLPLWIIIDFFS